MRACVAVLLPTSSPLCFILKGKQYRNPGNVSFIIMFCWIMLGWVWCTIIITQCSCWWVSLIHLHISWKVYTHNPCLCQKIYLDALQVTWQELNLLDLPISTSLPTYLFSQQYQVWYLWRSECEDKKGTTSWNFLGDINSFLSSVRTRFKLWNLGIICLSLCLKHIKRAAFHGKSTKVSRFAFRSDNFQVFWERALGSILIEWHENKL